MPLIRKLFKIGNSHGITLPADWLQYFEETEGKTVKKVSIEVDGELRIRPILETVSNTRRKKNET